jgi:hypothetical protein
MELRFVDGSSAQVQQIIVDNVCMRFSLPANRHLCGLQVEQHGRRARTLCKYRPIKRATNRVSGEANAGRGGEKSSVRGRGISGQSGDERPRREEAAQIHARRSV